MGVPLILIAFAINYPLAQYNISVRRSSFTSFQKIDILVRSRVKIGEPKIHG